MREFRVRERIRCECVSPLVGVFRQAPGNRAVRECANTMRDILKPRLNGAESRVVDVCLIYVCTGLLGVKGNTAEF